MKRNFGSNKLWVFLAAALFCLSVAAPTSSAQNIKIGAGVEDPCWNGNAGVPSPTPDGWCDVVGGEVNAILGDSFDWYQNSDQNTNIVSPLFLILAVPVENLLEPFFGGPATNPTLDGSELISPGKLIPAASLPCFFDCSAELAAATDVPISFTDPTTVNYSSYFSSTPNVFPEYWSPPGFPQGTLYANGETGASGVVDDNTSIYEFLGLPSNSVSMNVGNWTDLSQQVPSVILGCGVANPICDGPDDFIRPSGWKIYVYLLEHDISQGDAIEIAFDTTKIPLGTWVSGWAVGQKCTGQESPPDCAQNYFGMAVTESALLMPLPSVPEPTSLLLLGTGLAMVAGFSRKRGGKRR